MAMGGVAGGEEAADSSTSMGFIKIRNTDCLEQAHELVVACGGAAEAAVSGGVDERVAVLNMANAHRPGGGFRAGCGKLLSLVELHVSSAHP